MARKSQSGLMYLAGGNAAHLPGLYLDRRLIIVWPAGLKPTEERVLNIYRLWKADPTGWSPSRVRRELAAGGLLQKEVIS